MSTYIDDILKMHECGDLPSWILTAFVVKSLSERGDQSDYDNLPAWLKNNIRKRIAEYQADEGWLMFGSNREAEDYAPYAEKVLRKFDLGS